MSEASATRAAPATRPRPVIRLSMDPARTAHVLGPRQIDRLAAMTGAAIEAPRPSLDPAGLGAVTVLVTGWGCAALTTAHLDVMPRLRLIAHTAGSIKAIVPEEAFARGIAVSHAAAANAVPVAEFTLAAILNANKRVDAFRRLYTAARGRSEATRALGLEPIGNLGKTVGVIGASLIGRLVIAHLQRFGLAVLLADPYVDHAEAEALGAALVPLPDLMRRSDVVTLHAPLLPETRGMIDTAALAAMPDGATLINTARGAIVDTAALEREIASGRIGCVLDVTDPEPLPPSSPLWDAPSAILTPHVAGALGRECERLGDLAVDEVERFVTGAPLRHGIDPARLARIA